MRPDVRHCADQIESIEQAVVGGDDVGFGGNPADIAVRAFERSLPVLVPGVVGIEVASQEFMLAQHDPVIDGLRPERRRDAREQRRRTEHT